MQPTDFDWAEVLRPEAAPPIFWRHKWAEYKEKFGLPLAKKTLENFDSRGAGPARVEIAGRIAYRRQAVIEFLNAYGARRGPVVRKA